MSLPELEEVVPGSRALPPPAASMAVLVTCRPPGAAEMARLVAEFEVVVIAHDPLVAATMLRRLSADPGPRTGPDDAASGVPRGAAVATRARPATVTPLLEVVRGGDSCGDPLVLDAAHHLATWRGRPLPFTRRERTILGCLLDSPGSVLSYCELFERAWGTHYLGDPSLVHSALKRIRRKLRDAGAEVQIDAVRGVGFRTC